MKDDVSQIPLTGCSVLSSGSNLTNYQGRVRRDFSFNGGKWYLYRTTSSSYDYDISQYNCISPLDLSTNAQFEPLINFCAFSVVVIVGYVFFATIRRFLGAFS